MRAAYLDEEVDDHDDAAALLDASFPRRQIVVVVAVDDDQVDEDEPKHVDDQREHERHHHDVLVALALDVEYSQVAPCNVCEEENREVVISSAKTSDGAYDCADQEEVRDVRCHATLLSHRGCSWLVVHLSRI